jgi:hypothetical protein
MEVMAKKIEATGVECKDGRCTGLFSITAGCAQASVNPLWVFDGNDPLQFQLAFDMPINELATEALKSIWIDYQSDFRKIDSRSKVDALQDYSTMAELDKALAALVPKGKRGAKVAELRAQLSEKDRMIAELEAQLAAIKAQAKKK